MAEGVNDLLIRYGLVDLRRLLAPRLCLRDEHGVRAPGDKARDKKGERGQTDDDQRDLPVDRQHEDQRTEDRQDTGEKGGEAEEKSVGKLLDVGGDPTDRVTVRVRVEIGERETLDLRERRVPHILRNRKRDAVVERGKEPVGNARCGNQKDGL